MIVAFLQGYDERKYAMKPPSYKRECHCKECETFYAEKRFELLGKYKMFPPPRLPRRLFTDTANVVKCVTCTKTFGFSKKCTQTEEQRCLKCKQYSCFLCKNESCECGEVCQICKKCKDLIVSGEGGKEVSLCEKVTGAPCI